MKRLFVASMLSLALAGCAQSRSALSKADAAPPGAAATPPVAITPVPSIYDSVNQGMGGPALARTAMKDPANPQWSGRAPVASAATPAGSGGANPAPATSPARAPGPGSAAPAELNVQLPPSGRPLAGAAPPLAAAPPSAAGSTGGQVMSSLPSAASPAGSSGAEPSVAALPEVAPAPANALRSNTAAPAASAALGMPVDSQATATQPTAATPADAAVSRSGSQSSLMPEPSPATQPPITPAAVPHNQAPERSRDPLLGPDPDLMPPMPDLDEVKSPARPATPLRPDLPAVKSPATPPESDLPAVKSPAGPARPSSADLPAVKSPGSPPPLGAPEAPAAKSAASSSPSQEGPPIEPAPAAPVTALPPGDPAVLPQAGPGAAKPLEQPADAGKSSAVSKPATAGSLAAAVPLELAPAAFNVIPAAVSARATAPGPPPPRSDPQILRTSAPPATDDSTQRRRLTLEPGCSIARVGDEIITYHDLVHATREMLSNHPLPQGFDSEGQIERNQYINMAKMNALESMIDRCLLVQEAKRNISDKKLLDRVYQEADQIWHDSEILPLQRKYNVDNEQQLKEKLAGQGRSLDAMRQSFRQTFLAETFIRQKLRDRGNVELPDLLKYYNEHLHTHEFDRPAQIRWRELVVEVARYESSSAARRKADGLLEAIKGGEDLAKLARAQSDGPTSSRNRGGLMETSPGGYAVAPVNTALLSLPIGQVSPVIEGPQSFHIVQVESRRPAGPASFEEVQDTIKPIVQNQKMRAERTAFINKLREKTLITVFSPKKTTGPPQLVKQAPLHD